MIDPPGYTLLCGDARDILDTLPDESVHCVITSPPYFGLRNYSTRLLLWPPQGGRQPCQEGMHDWRSCGSKRNRWGLDAGLSDRQASMRGNAYEVWMGQECARCGAWLGTLGNEPTPQMYVEHLVDIFRRVRRVLRPDGTLWLNLGDSYAGSGRGPSGKSGIGDQERRQGFHDPPRIVPDGYKPKDLIGIPWRVAFALQEDGWYLRRDIIWAKPNPMPESVKDRPSTAHEYIFLLTKNPTYYYDYEAVLEPLAEDTLARLGRGVSAKHKYVSGAPGQRPHTLSRPRGHGEGYHIVNPKGRNRRSVWIIPTHGYRGAHFATFPERLVEPCVLAGSPPGGTVLDPFSGSGTTGVVALRYGRRYIGIELNQEYIDLSRERLDNTQRRFL